MRATSRTAAVVLLALLCTGWAAAGPDKPRAAVVGSAEVMDNAMKDLRAHVSNATFKLRNGVTGMEGTGQGFTPQGCCEGNMQVMRAALDALARERSDLQRTFERQRNQDAIAKVGALSDALRTLEEGFKKFVDAQKQEEAVAVLQAMVRALDLFDEAKAPLVACCLGSR